VQKRPLFALVALTGFTLFGQGCRVGKQQTKLQYMPDMVDSPTVKSQESYIDPPDGAVSMNTLLYPKSVEEAEKILAMPGRISGNPNSEKEGEALYNTFCIPCHGADAKGQGTLGPKAASLKPQDITQELYSKRGDGFFFYRITFGTSVMPGYGHSLSSFERWQIVSYLRSLQKKAH
jgi:cytochrome c